MAFWICIVAIVYLAFVDPFVVAKLQKRRRQRRQARDVLGLVDILPGSRPGMVRVNEVELPFDASPERIRRALDEGR